MLWSSPVSYCEMGWFELRWKVVAVVMRIPAQGIRVLWQQWTNSHGLQKSCGEKAMAQPLSQGESATTLALTGFYWLSNSIHQRWFSFIILRFALGNYFLQIATERMLLITSYRLTRKKCCKCKGTIRVIGLVNLGELPQTSGSYFKDMQ